MSFLEQIKQGSKLNKTSGPVERKYLKNRMENTEDYEKLLSNASMEYYLDVIKPYTFHSEIAPITVEQCRVLTEENEKYKRFKESHSDQVYTEWKNRKELIDLQDVIQQEIEKERKRKNDPEASVFIRLSTISPKDAVVNMPSFRNTIREAESFISDLEQNEGVDFVSDMNRKVYALYIAGTTGMKISSAEKAIQLFVESERAQQEFKSKVENPETKLLNIIVREWADFDVALEFRGFVNEKKFTAMTQYNPYIYFPHLVKQKDAFETMCRNFVENTLLKDDKLTINSFIVDLLIVLKPGRKFEDQVENLEDKYEVRVIELNPFAEMAGTCLFKFGEDDDQLYGTGDKTNHFEFRMVKELPQFVLQKIDTCWARFLE